MTKDKCNEEYAEFYRKNRIEGNREAVYVNALTPALDKINKEELQKMYSARRSTKQMAEHFGVSLYSINTFIHQNNMVR